jgi:ATP-dependent Lhr-like helicase
VRWGVVFRDLVAREPSTVPWRDLLWAFRRMEARGIVRGGRFVSGFVGEQYALPEAVDQLRRVRRMERRSEKGEPGEIVTLSAVDPLNLTGVLLPGPKVPRVRTQEVRFRDGLPLVSEGRVAVSGARNADLLGRRL